MFYVIKNNQLYEYGDKISSGWNCPEDAKELLNVSMEFFKTHREQFEIQNGVLVDISATEAYKKSIVAAQKAQRISEIKKELDALDLKCIRAMREGGNDEAGIPYLEKYQSEINQLREELNTLE